MPTDSLPHHGRSTWLSVGTPGLEGVVDAEMVLQIGADIGVVDDHRNAELAEQRPPGRCPKAAAAAAS